jgi:hypothetical protein
MTPENWKRLRIKESNMNSKNIIRTSALAGFVTAHKLAYSSRILLPVLALCAVPTAWGQPPGDLSGRRVPPNLPPGILQAEPNRVPADMLNRFRPPQRNTVPPTASDGAAQGQAAGLPAFAQYSFVNVNIPNSALVSPMGINNAGLVTGSYADASYNSHGFVWQAGTVQTLDYPSAVNGTYLEGVNNHGVLIGFYYDVNFLPHALTYSVNTASWTALPDIPDYGGSLGVGINDDGAAVGNAVSGFPFQSLAWIWHPDSKSYSFFNAPAAAEQSTSANSINEGLTIVGNLSTVPSYGFEPGFIKQGDEFTEIMVPSATYTIPYGINRGGTVSGFFTTSTSAYGFVRTSNGLLTTVNYPGSGATYVLGINDQGALCGQWYDTTSSQYLGFVALRR